MITKKAAWAIFDQAGKQVEVFPYNKKQDAEKKLADMNREVSAKQLVRFERVIPAGSFYINMVKEWK